MHVMTNECLKEPAINYDEQPIELMSVPTDLIVSRVSTGTGTLDSDCECDEAMVEKKSIPSEPRRSVKVR